MIKIVKYDNVMRKTCTKVMLLIVFTFFLNPFSEAQELYVGANYHPHDDKNIEKIKSDHRGRLED
ncbi:hypothetical protein QUH73_09140 [Labilibaculum sp. K2S]|uniref:hypothetical protein n=1 Tax=Labilibaculum sp. K2S TaxID=3056386 RepID=UPI0025A34C05|nr:hypothetical protein [Labilibaculum sp. K2S]MDM8159977.1 hypothetical protein [Labilibaculum sp. K2S]